MQTPTAAPTWTLSARPQKKYARWAVVASGLTHAEAVALIGSRPKCDWSLSHRPGEIENSEPDEPDEPE